MKVWYNDRIADSEHIDLDEGYWPKGSGIFETLRTEKQMVYELGRHMRRAVSSCQRMGIKPPDESFIRKSISEIILLEPHDLGRLRLHFSLENFISIHQSYEEPIAPLKVALDPNPVDPTIPVLKKFPYTANLSRLQRSQSQGFDEALSHNSRGYLSEGAVSNYLFRIGGYWVTPALSTGVLPGVMRAIAIERAGVKVRSIRRDQIQEIESGIALSSMKLAVAISHIDSRELSMDQDMQDLIALIREKTQRGSVD